MNTLPHKGYGRIFVDKTENIQAVKDIIKEMDEFEFYYMPEKIIAHFDEYPSVVYTHKFDDLDMDALTATCWSRGIFVWVFCSGNNDFPQNKIANQQIHATVNSGGE